MRSFTCEAILFDLDGVLVDSTPCVARVWSEWARERHLDPDYVVHVAHGQRTIETVRKVAPHLDAQRETEEIERREIGDTNGLRVLPGAKELLTALPADRFAIVTSCTRRLASKRLRAAGLPVPPAMITADDVTRGKPNPEPYLAGATALGRNPQKCLVFEDAPSGIAAANAAGMVAIALTTTFPAKDLSQADCIVGTLANLKVELTPVGELIVRSEKC
jgi:sugar-phosphatase